MGSKQTTEQRLKNLEEAVDRLDRISQSVSVRPKLDRQSAMIELLYTRNEGNIHTFMTDCEDKSIEPEAVVKYYILKVAQMEDTTEMLVAEEKINRFAADVKILRIGEVAHDYKFDHRRYANVERLCIKYDIQITDMEKYFKKEVNDLDGPSSEYARGQAAETLRLFKLHNDNPRRS